MVTPDQQLAPVSDEDACPQFDNRIDLAPFIDWQGELSWAFRKALLFPNIGIFYSLIPKNACTSILSALARENGLNSPWFQARNRIHNVQSRFWAFEEIARFHDDTFKVIAFRDPFLRLLSAFNNKIVGTNAEHFVHQKFFETRLGKKIADCRFSEIVRIADRGHPMQIDEHFAPQWSFIFYPRYDLIIDADRPIGRLDLGDRRIELVRHNRKPAAASQTDLGDATVAEIREHLRQSGQLPGQEGQDAIFRSNLSKGGNFDRDFQLHATLRKGRFARA